MLVGRASENVVDQRRSLTDDEDADDADQRHGNVPLCPTAAQVSAAAAAGDRGHLQSTAMSPLQSLHQSHVEEAERQQRATVNDDEVEDVGVDDAVEQVPAEVRYLEPDARPISAARHALLDALVLEEQVVRTDRWYSKNRGTL